MISGQVAKSVVYVSGGGVTPKLPSLNTSDPFLHSRAAFFSRRRSSCGAPARFCFLQV